MIKRVFDLLFSCIALILLSPLFIIIAVLIKIDSTGPVFYRGERIGRYGKPFKVFKFRSMVVNAEKTGINSTAASDFRITRIGRLIRKYKLDELPQLINVFKGEMSIVGPRPQVLSYLERFSEEEKEILNLKPGITDWASIIFNDEGAILENSGIKDADKAYDTVIHPVKMQYQLKYLREQSIWVDIKIIFSTILTIIHTRRGGQPFGVPSLGENIKDNLG